MNEPAQAVLYFNHAPSQTPISVSGEQHAKGRPASGHGRAGDPSAPAHGQRERKHVKIPPEEKDSTSGRRLLSAGAANSDPAPVHQEKAEVGKAAAHQVP